jgi:putative tricarboxylic transport membrane protein
VASNADIPWLSAGREVASLVMSLVFLGLSAVFLIAAARLDLGSATMPGPGMFPTLAAGLLTVLSGVAVIRAILGLRSRTGATIGIGHLNSLLAAALLVAMAVLFEPTGAMLSSFVFVGVLAAALTRRRLWAAALFSAALSIAVVLVFQRALEVPLPTGLFTPF